MEDANMNSSAGDAVPSSDENSRKRTADEMSNAGEGGNKKDTPSIHKIDDEASPNTTTVSGGQQQGDTTQPNSEEKKEDARNVHVQPVIQSGDAATDQSPPVDTSTATTAPNTATASTPFLMTTTTTTTTITEGAAPSEAASAATYNNNNKDDYSNLKWIVVRNDGKPESMIKLVGLKSLFAKQLPKMPRAYIARLVLDPRHTSLAILSDKPDLKDTDEEIIGGICYRAFPEMRFAVSSETTSPCGFCFG